MWLSNIRHGLASHCKFLDTPLTVRDMILAIIQARINSTRLPAKVLLDLAGKPILSWVVERLRRSKLIDKILIATSEAERDDPVALLASNLGVDCFRGSEIDVLNRYYRAALSVS